MRVYPDTITPQTYDTWYDSLKKYIYDDVYYAVRSYINESSFNPKPADIIRRIPRAIPTQDNTPRFVQKTDGTYEKLIVCKQCNDTGLITWCENDIEYGKPCQCKSGHDNYTWGWLDRSEQENFIQKCGHHGEIVGERWYE